MATDHATHTPGPWARDGNMIVVTIDGITATLAHVLSCYVPRGRGAHHEQSTAKANARLIARAPDLLACLERLVSSLEFPKASVVSDHEFPAAMAAAKAEIREARGPADAPALNTMIL